MRRTFILIIILSVLCLFSQTTKSWAQQTCTVPLNFVVLGSSTSFGMGASVPDSAYVNRFQKYLIDSVNAGSTVINLALGGLTTYAAQPDWFVPPPAFPVDVTRNITKAVSLNPHAIIINFPTNDAANNFTLTVQKDNFLRMIYEAAGMNIRVWITTTQPRNFPLQADRDSLIAMKDWIVANFGNKVIDFWTDIAMPDGTINPVYSYGDGIHLNDAGHRLLFERLLASVIVRATCLYALPLKDESFLVTNPGNDAELQWSVSGNSQGAIFFIEYSSDGTKWNDAGSVEAGSKNFTYSFLHKNAASLGGTLYYRLRIVSPGQKTTFSSIRKIIFTSNTKKYFLTTSGMNINIHSNAEETSSFYIYTTGGSLYKSGSIKNGFTSVPVLQKGLYFVNIVNDKSYHRTWKIVL
ncbi:MAG: SGNH/GDSL hydrolase family protein [Bacteroidota bacterium]